MHCDFGEDELVCGAPDCPPTCQCSGYAMKCYTFITFDASFKRLTMFILRHPKLMLAKQIFQYVTSLLILDMSFCNITSISSEGPFFDLNTLVRLDLSHNAISSLAHGSLDGLLNLIKLDISWNPLNYFETRVFFHMKRLRILLLQHCQLHVVPDIVLPNTQRLDILDMSSGGVIDLGCLSLKVAVFNLTNTVKHDHKDYNRKCWKDIIHVVSDQTGLCCLNFFKGRCDGGWAIERRPCQSLLRNQTFLFYCGILVMLIVTCNCCVFIYVLLTKSRDAILICNLALANFFIAVPVYIFISWHVTHGTEFSFFESFLSRSMGCSVSGDILVLSTQLATLFQMLISLDKYCGIVRRCNILSETKLFVYLVITAAWIISFSACALLHFQDMDEKQTTTILKGLFYYYSYKYPILPAFSALNMTFILVSLLAYRLILKNIYDTRFTHIGHKHGKDSSLSSIIRVTIIMVFSNISVLAIICITTWLSLVRREWSQILVLTVLVYPLQAVLNPFLFTISTKRFITDCRRCLNSVREALACTQRKV